MTPFDTALSRLRDAVTSSACAVALSPASAAVRTRRTAVLRDDLTDLLRRRAASLVRMRLIWDLILATPDCLRFVDGERFLISAAVGNRHWSGRKLDARTDVGARDLQDYQQPLDHPNLARRPSGAVIRSCASGPALIGRSRRPGPAGPACRARPPSSRSPRDLS